MDDDLKIKDINLAVDGSGQKTYQTLAYNAAGTIGMGRLDANTSWWTGTCIKANAHTKDIPEVPSSQLHGTSQSYTTYLLPWESLPASCWVEGWGREGKRPGRRGYMRREGATTARPVANIGAGAAMEIPEEDPGAGDLPVHRLTPCTAMEALNRGVGRVGAEEDLDADGLGEGAASEASFTGGELWATATTPEKDKIAEENWRQESEKMADIGPWAVMVVEEAEEYSHADNMRSWTSAEETSTSSEDLCEE